MDARHADHHPRNENVPLPSAVRAASPKGVLLSSLSHLSLVLVSVTKMGYCCALPLCLSLSEMQQDRKMWALMILCFCIGIMAAIGMGGYGFYKSLQLRNLISNDLMPGFSHSLFPVFSFFFFHLTKPADEVSPSHTHFGFSSFSWHALILPPPPQSTFMWRVDPAACLSLPTRSASSGPTPS